MVSQRVSQNRKPQTLDTPQKKKQATACPGKKITNSEKIIKQSSTPLALPVSRKSRKGEQKSSKTRLQSIEYLTQSNTLSSGDNPDEIVGLHGSQLASTAPSPNSQEEVSGMPGRGNGCIFRKTTNSGKTVWKVEVTVGHGLDGKRIRTRRSAHSLAEARALHRKLIAELHIGDLKTKSSESFSEYSIWWLKTVKSMRVRQSTLADYEDRLRRTIFPYFGNRRLDDITSRDVETWLYQLQKRGSATPTINGARQVLGAVFKHAVKSGAIANNPVSFTERAKRQLADKTSLQTPWSLQETKDVLQATKGTEFDLFVRLGCLLGARRGEILGLQWSDINIGEGYLLIRSSLREQRVFQPDGSTKTSLVVGETKTLSSRRKLVLSAEILASLQRHREVVSKLKIQSNSSWSQTDWVFVNSRGGLTNPSNFAKQFTNFLKQENIRTIRIHDMRHTAAVLSLEAGVRLESVSQALGHSRIDITKSVYAPYVQPLMTEFSVGLSEYVSPIDPQDLGHHEDSWVKSHA